MKKAILVAAVSAAISMPVLAAQVGGGTTTGAAVPSSNVTQQDANRDLASGSVALGAGSSDGGQSGVVAVGNSSIGLTRRITGVAPGVSPSDAATVGQVQQAAGAVQQQLVGVQRNLQQQIDATGAVDMAASQIQLPRDKRNAIGVGLGSQGGQTAIAIGLVKQVRDDLQVRATVGYADGVATVGGGVSFGW